MSADVISAQDEKERNIFSCKTSLTKLNFASSTEDHKARIIIQHHDPDVVSCAKMIRVCYSGYN